MNRLFGYSVVVALGIACIAFVLNWPGLSQPAAAPSVDVEEVAAGERSVQAGSEGHRVPLGEQVKRDLSGSPDPSIVDSQSSVRLASLLTPRNQQGDWRTDDARVVENIAMLLRRPKESVAEFLLSSGRLADALSLYRITTEVSEEAWGQFDEAKRLVFDEKFLRRSVVEIDPTTDSSNESFRSQFGIGVDHIVATRTVRAVDGPAHKQVAWIAPDESPTVNALRLESDAIQLWRDNAVRGFFADSPLMYHQVAERR